jgi:hypothetical protein
VRYCFISFIFLFALQGYGVTLRYTDPRTEIPIVFECDENMFPESWIGGSINATALPVDTSEIERSIQVILRCFSKYPVDVLKNNLARVYVVSYLHAYETPMGGTRSESRVYVNNEGADMGYTDEAMEHIFHAEFSSILYLAEKTRFNEKKFASYNDTSFTYANDDFLSIREGRSTQTYDSLLNAQGLLNAYGATTLENDLNAFAQQLFLPDENFWPLLAKNPRLYAKALHVIDFYASFSPGFTLDFFRSLKPD